VLAGLRRTVAGMGPDRYMAPEMDLVTAMVTSGKIVEWAETVTGPLD
jgi:histidine ammonia-lyase